MADLSVPVAAIKSMSMVEVVEFYGFHPNRSGFIKCPFHQGDRNGSLKVYHDHFHCYGCGRNGDAIHFVEELFGMPFADAVRKLDADFNLGLCNSHIDEETRRKAAERLREVQKANALSQAAKNRYCELMEEATYWERIKAQIEPANERYLDDPHNAPLLDLYRKASSRLVWLEYAMSGLQAWEFMRRREK